MLKHYLNKKSKMEDNLSELGEPFSKADKYFGKILNYWLKLSNSGNTLKLMVPSRSRKTIGGWGDDPSMVKNHKMIEKEMGNRGSKSRLLLDLVKEQRVDGSWDLNLASKKIN